VKIVSGRRLEQWRKQARQAAIAADLSPDEVDWILQDLSEIDRLDLRLGTFADRDRIALHVDLEELDRLWQKRIRDRVPLQYLTGVAPWRNFELSVSPDVLVPRPETEELVDVAIAATRRTKLDCDRGIWADLGTGSGAIALGLSVAFPEATICAVDISKAALAVARRNAEKLNCDRVQFYCGSWFEPLEQYREKLCAIVSNPPYIPSGEVPKLQPEVSRHEPHLALDGGEDGLNCIRQLVRMAPQYLQPGGIWLVEMMAGQAGNVVELLEQQGSYRDIQIIKDMGNMERFALAYSPDGV